MKNFLKKTFDFFRVHKIWSVIICLVIVGIFYSLFFSSSNNIKKSFALVEQGTIKEEVSVTGNVKPISEVNLAFERGGKVSGISVAIGDKVYSGQYLASVSNADLSANLDQARANLKITELQLGKVSSKQIVENAKVDNAILNLAQAETSLLNSIKDSYTKADDAVKNKIYSLFTNGVKYRSTLSFSTDSFLKEEVEEGKDIATDNLYVWYRSLLGINNDLNDLNIYFNSAKDNLDYIKDLLDKCAIAVNGLSSDSIYLSQTQIDTWKLNISTARTSIDLAIVSLTNSFNQYQSAILALRTAQSDFSIQEITIDQAKASVAMAEAELAKTIIYSPLTGVITNLDIKIGEIVSANKNIISIISYGDYEIESFIPEADISKVKIGDITKTTLDSYNDAIFETVVSKIDPAATIIAGVPTYKITLNFIKSDNRIKSGMTANLDILTNQKELVLTIPSRAVITRDGEKFVKILTSDGQEKEVKIEVGLKGSDGRIEVISGLQIGEKVITSS